VPVYAFGPFELDLDAFELRRESARIEIARKPFDALAYLVQNPGRLIPKDEFIRHVWGMSAISPSTLPTCISVIRKALSDDSEGKRYLETVRGRGYRFVAEPVVRGHAVAATRVSTPLSLPSLSRGRSPFVGRSQEIAVLNAALQRANMGTAELVLLFGEPGIGKTRILEEFRPLAHTAGLDSAIARCRESEGAPALWPWVQIIRSYVEPRRASRSQSEMSLVAPLLEQIDPDFHVSANRGSSIMPLDPATARFQLFDGVSRFLRKEARERPLLLLFDDLHRSDVASLLLLRFAARELRNARILFVATFRDSEAADDPTRASLLGELARQEGARSIQLSGLSREDVGLLVDELGLAQESGDRLVAVLHDQSGGNPFFLTQLLQLLEDRNAVTCDARSATEPVATPRGLREAILAQIEGLPTGTREILAAAAVAGREFSVAVLAAAVDETFEGVLEHLTPAERRRIVNPNADLPGDYRFAHVLLRDALYEELSAPDRVRLHLRIGQALKNANKGNPGPVAAELSYHFFEAAHVGGAALALRYSTLAAEWATERLAYEDAPRHYAVALKTLDLTQAASPLERGELLVALGQAELRADQRAAGRETLQTAASLARSIREPRLLTAAALSLAPGPFAIEVGVYDSLLVSLLEEALQAIGPEHTLLQTQLSARLSLALTWGESEPRRRHLSHQALQGARALFDHHTLAHALMARHGVLGGPEYLCERLEIANEIGSLGGPARDPTLGFMHRLLRITDLLEDGNIAAVDQEANLYAQEAASTQLPYFSWYTSLFKAMRARMGGRFDEARHFADEFYAVGQRVGDENSAQSYACHQVLQFWEDARPADAIHLIRAFIERFPSVRGWRSVLAAFCHENRQQDAARREFEELASRGFENVPRNEVWNITIATLAMVCAWLNDQERAQTLYELLLPGTEHYVVVGFGVALLGSVSQYLGMLAATMERWEEASRHFEHAVEQNLRVGALPWVAHTRYEHARALSLRTGSSHRDRARKEAAEAVRIAKRLGMKNIYAKASALLS
jgi:DNA-binding winged helix-turn-helix (wHTH) protein/tetratricopeptide (TPR) repeat protein